MDKGIIDKCAVDVVIPRSDGRAYVLYWVGQEQYGIAVEFVRRIIDGTELMQTPDAVPVIEGMLEYEGCEIPVMDMRKLLSVPGSYSGRRVIIVAEIEGNHCGLMVDRIYGMDVVPDFMTSGIDDTLN